MFIIRLAFKSIENRRPLLKYLLDITSNINNKNKDNEHKIQNTCSDFGMFEFEQYSINLARL